MNGVHPNWWRQIDEASLQNRDRHPDFFRRNNIVTGTCSEPQLGLRTGAEMGVMKAIVYRCYGSPDVLGYEDVKKPTPADDEVLIKVVAASVNPLDWHYMRGSPYIMRLMSGLGAPKETSMGVDFAGTVESVGRNVKKRQAVQAGR